MTDDLDLYDRRSIRLRGYDYSMAGAYFLTVCTQEGQCIFGDVVDGRMQLNDAGEMVRTIWNTLPARYGGVELDAFVVMPNHIHGIVVLSAVNVGAPLVGAHPPFETNAAQRAGTRPAPTVGQIVGGFKSITTVQYVRGVKQLGWRSFSTRLWQRNYYEHIIRNNAELDRIREYILYNPAQWSSDRDNPYAQISAPAPEPWEARE